MPANCLNLANGTEADSLTVRSGGHIKNNNLSFRMQGYIKK